MEDVSSALLTLGFTAGTVLFAVLAALAWRAGRLSGREPGVLGLAAAGLLWNGGRLVLDVAALAGAPPSTALAMTFAAAFSSTVLLPPLALEALRPVAWGAPWRERAARWLRVLSRALAAALTLALLAAAAVPDDRLRISDVQ